jgi:1,4-alpha-glucan branching enzyme
MKKQFAKNSVECKVTFQIPAELLNGSKSASVAGEFNGWNAEANPVKITKGVGSVSIALPVGKEFQYKFIIDGQRWENDPEADKYISNEYGEANSIVETYQ